MSESLSESLSNSAEYTIRVNSGRYITDDMETIEVPPLSLPGDIPTRITVSYNSKSRALTITPYYSGSESKQTSEISGDVHAIIGRISGRVYNIHVLNYKKDRAISKHWEEIRKKFESITRDDPIRIDNNLNLFTKILAPSLSRFRSRLV